MSREDAPSDFRQTLERYLDVAATHLDAHDAEVDRYVIAPSPVTWDGGCDGQLWTRLASFAPMPGDGASQLCGVNYWIVTVGVGIIRRISVVGPQGAPPYPEEVTADALQQAEDARILKDAILDVEFTRSFVSWNPLAPQGGFAGGEWLINVRVPNIFRPSDA